MNPFFAFFFNIVSIPGIPAIITVIMATIAWLIQKKFLRVNSLSWPLILSITWLSSLLAMAFILYINTKELIYVLLIYLITITGIPFTSIRIFSRTGNRFIVALKSFMPVSIPLITLFFLLIFDSLQWTAKASAAGYGVSNIKECNGFPLPCWATFYQHAGSGDFEFNKFNFLIDLVLYILLAYLVYYILKKLLNFKQIVLKVLLIAFCGFFYYLSFLQLLVFSIDGCYPWPDKVELFGLHFRWLGI